MVNLQCALQLLSTDKITGEQTTLIDAALSVADAHDISGTDAEIVIDYIDTQLVHNTVNQEVRSALDNLQEQLKAREAG